MTPEHKHKAEYMSLLREKFVRQARTDLLQYTKFTMPTFEPTPFHVAYYNILTKFAYGYIRKLMVFMPPQHGKSEGSTRRLPSFIDGIYPDKMVVFVPMVK